MLCINLIGLPGTQIFGQTLFGCICEGIFWILTFKSIDECDQNGRVRGHGNHLPAVNTSEITSTCGKFSLKTNWRLTESLLYNQGCKEGSTLS